MSSSVITVNRKFPFSAPLDLATSEASQRQFGKQIVAFYHHCQKYAEIFTSHSHNKKILCKMDLSQRDVEWREVSEEKSILKTIKAISVTMWTNQYSARQEWTFSLTIDSHPSIETYTIDDQSIIPLKHLPFACLNGNEYETVRFPSANTSTFEDKEWDDWKEKMKPAATNYRTLLYPIFQLALQIKEPLSQERGILRQFKNERSNFRRLLPFREKISAWPIG